MPVVVILIVTLVMMPRMFMPLGVLAEFHVGRGVRAPIHVASFPPMKARQTYWIASNPDVVGTQVEILVANDADVFVTVPDVGVRNADLHRYRGRGNLHGYCGRRRRDDLNLDSKPSRPCHQWQDCEAGNPHHTSDFCRSFHIVPVFTPFYLRLEGTAGKTVHFALKT